MSRTLKPSDDSSSPPETSAPVPVRTAVDTLYLPYAETAEVLRKFPGTWHLIGEGTEAEYSVMTQVAYRIRKGLTRAFRHGKWEARIQTVYRNEVIKENSIQVRRNVPERVELYARFLSD